MAGAIDEEDQQLNRTEMLKAFDETKAGVKGLIDSGQLPKLAKIFMRPSDELIQDQLTTTLQIHEEVPVIDLTDVHNNRERRKQVVEQVRAASESWGFFQVVNHGILSDVVNGMIDGVQRFNDLDVEDKNKYYSRDNTRSVRYNSSYDLFTARTASWRDTLIISFNSGTDSQDPQELPPTCSAVSRSTLKRACRDNNITRWPSNERSKANPSLFRNKSTNCHLDFMIVEADYEGDTIKFKLPFSSGMEKIEEEIGRRLKLNVNSFKMKYMDEDGKWILLTCDDDLEFCEERLASSGGDLVRLLVQLY